MLLLLLLALCCYCCCCTVVTSDVPCDGSCGQRMYYDAISYHDPTFECGVSFAGSKNIVFGTDHPFFPPSVKDGDCIDDVPWKSCTSNLHVIGNAAAQVQVDVLRTNAQQLLGL